MKRTRRPRSAAGVSSEFTGFGFPPEVILLATALYLRFGLSSRDLEELLAGRGIEVDHLTLYRWVQRFTPLLIEAARPSRHWPRIAGSSTKPTSRSRGLAVRLSGRGPTRAGDRRVRVATSPRRAFFTAALTFHGEPTEVITDRAPALANVLENLLPRCITPASTRTTASTMAD